MAKEINLGVKYGESNSYSVTPPQVKLSDEYYPCLHLENVEGLNDLPDEGTLTVRYRISREVDDKKNDRKCLDLDVLAITNVEAESASEDAAEPSTAEALEALRSAIEGEKE